MLPLYRQKALPDAIVVTVNQAVRAAQADPETRQRLAAAYIEPLPLGPAESEAVLAAEHERLSKLIQQLGIKADGA
jgi:tripartite-type tricarboxylate transporter receptor subunit TctC